MHSFLLCICSLFLFFFTDPPTTEIYTLSLHDALPISGAEPRAARALPPLLPRSDESWVDRLVQGMGVTGDRKSTRLNSSHITISYAVFCLKKKKKQQTS